jgi:alpha-galactosidase
MRSDISFNKLVFNANGGRSESFLPYFNIHGSNFSAAAAVGWTGQWYSSLKSAGNGVRFTAKQEFFKAPLLPGEEIRSPLVTLCFYEGNNPLAGFNQFRKFEKDCVYPESIGVMNGYVIANEFSRKTCDELIEEVNSIDEEIIDGTDYFWMDAGWYEYNEGWYDGVGNWTPDRSRFPDGLKPLSDAMAARDKKFLLWYEPERVRENTVLYNEGIRHEGWIVQIGDNLLWNLGNDEACRYLSEYIAASLRENGVSMYRQDFNFCPLEYWNKADKEFCGKRKGITENHYVSNLYAYLDYLMDAVDGLVIDNCASGGKRLDIEMTRRSLPLWRSDYNCGNEDGTVKEDVLEATQSMTYGLSCWLVYSGTNRYFHSEYASRSAILTDQSVYMPAPSEYNAYADISRYMTGNYFPLTYGGTNRSRFLAMQFGSGDEGAAVIYKREKVKENSYTLVLNGLEPERIYRVTDIDSPGVLCEKTGEELMTGGINLTISDTPKAAVIKYSGL